MITRLKKERFFRGIKQIDLMKETGIYHTRISLIENGYCEPNSEEKLKLAKALRIAVEELFPKE